MAKHNSKPIIVLAGNRREFEEYAKGDRRFIFGDSHNMRGLDAAEVRGIGTFWQRKDARELKIIALEGLRSSSPLICGD